MSLCCMLQKLVALYLSTLSRVFYDKHDENILRDAARLSKHVYKLKIISTA